MPVPESNPLSPKIALGRKLFFDKRLSRNGTVACVSCHDPKLAFFRRPQGRAGNWRGGGNSQRSGHRQSRLREDLLLGWTRDNVLAALE